MWVGGVFHEMPQSSCCLVRDQMSEPSMSHTLEVGVDTPRSLHGISCSCVFFNALCRKSQVCFSSAVAGVPSPTEGTYFGLHFVSGSFLCGVQMAL